MMLILTCSFSLMDGIMIGTPYLIGMRISSKAIGRCYCCVPHWCYHKSEAKSKTVWPHKPIPFLIAFKERSTSATFLKGGNKRDVDGAVASLAGVPRPTAWLGD